MSTTHKQTAFLLAAITTVLILVLGSADAQAAPPPPIKLVPASHFGFEVNATTGGNVCTVVSGNACQAGKESSEAAAAPGGFAYPEGVAVDDFQTASSNPHYGDVYVADTNNHRVQELSATGVFVSMFGGEVNKTEDETPGATLAQKDVCTAKSHDVCKAGVEGSAAGQFEPYSLAVDQSTGNVYVQDTANARVQEFTAAGEFVLMFGKDVNPTTGGDVCTETEIQAGTKCKAGERGVQGASEPGAFDFPSSGDLLAVGGPEHLLYVGDESRVQEFKANGSYVNEISLVSINPEPEQSVRALAADEAGDVYLVYPTPPSSANEYNTEYNVLRKFGPHGEELYNKLLAPPACSGETKQVLGETKQVLEVSAIALDFSGHLAVTAGIVGRPAVCIKPFASLYDAATGSPLSEIPVASASHSRDITFSAQGEFYAVQEREQEVVASESRDVAELLTLSQSCATGTDQESDATFACTLNGEANPEGISETEVWFQLENVGSQDHETARQPVTGSTPMAVPAVLAGLEPNETFQYYLAGYDHNIQPPETPFKGQTLSFTTPLVAPRILGSSASFVTSSSAVLFAELNPEHANTRYEFQYGPCENLDNCPAKTTTTTLESSTYGETGTTQEATGLQPNTQYHYRLLASNEQETAGHKEGGEVTGPENTFTTGLPPSVQAATGGPSAITATSATISGTINPDGKPATYSFELGVYTGGSTQYGIVYSASTSAETTPIGESLGLSGLQPGTTYAYRISIHSGYGTAEGQPVTFTTEGLPAVLASPAPLPMLATPNVAFPSSITTKPASKTKKAKAKAKKTKHKKQKKKKQRPRKHARK